MSNDECDDVCECGDIFDLHVFEDETQSEEWCTAFGCPCSEFKRTKRIDDDGLEFLLRRSIAEAEKKVGAQACGDKWGLALVCILAKGHSQHELHSDGKGSSW